MKKLGCKLVICMVLIGSCINVMGAEVKEENLAPINYELQEGSKAYLQINNKTYVPLRELANKVGVQNFQWRAGEKGRNVKAYITLEAPAYFWKFYYSVLTMGLEPYNQSTDIMPLPESLQGLLVGREIEYNPMNASRIYNDKPIDLTVVSEGYETGRVIYDYTMIDNILYVPVNEIETYFGIYTTQNQLQVKLKEQISEVEEALKLENPRDVLALWIRGQQLRSGALQYAVLCNDLQEAVLPEVKVRGWVTGGSSPSLGGMVIIKNEEEINESTLRYTVQYESMLQGQVYEILEQVIEMKTYEAQDKIYWRISKVNGDVGYYTFNNVVVETK